MIRVNRCSEFFLAIAIVLLAATTAVSQTPANSQPVPVFEVASIRQNLNPNPRWNMYFTPDGVHASDVTLVWALHEAYGLVDDQRWAGVPDWANEKRFDIEAKFDTAQFPNLSREQRQAMLQQLFADRFKLVVHHEAKEFPLYALAVAKGGPKFKESKPEEIHQGSSGPECLITRSRPGVLGMQGCTMTNFVGILTGWTLSDLGRTIVDQTELTGRYTLALQWTPENASAANPADSSAPFIFTALREQLGLELKATKGPLDTIVIDHVEMPTEN